eukprot:Sdes_comp22087_c0_seq1m20618
MHRVKNKGGNGLIDCLNWGIVGIYSKGMGVLTYRQINCIKFIIDKELGKDIKLWFRVTPNESVTKKPAGLRMGKGKGKIETWQVRISKGVLIFELDRQGPIMEESLFYSKVETMLRIINSKLGIELGVKRYEIEL